MKALIQTPIEIITDAPCFELQKKHTQVQKMQPTHTLCLNSDRGGSDVAVVRISSLTKVCMYSGHL